jgi:hypothetical protein
MPLLAGLWPLAGRFDRRKMVLAAADQVGIDPGPLRAESGSEALAEWADLIDELRDRVLWDDRDYLAGDAFLDLDPAVGDVVKEQLGMAEDYYSAAPIEPTTAGVEEIRASLRRICPDLGPGEAMLLCDRIRPFPGLDPSLCRLRKPRVAGLSPDTGSQLCCWPTNWILSPVSLPYSWYWKHVAVVLKVCESKASTSPRWCFRIVAAWG